MADEATALRGAYDQSISMARDKNNRLTKTERNGLKKEAKETMVKIKELMNSAGSLFAQIDLDQHAA